ncbi:MAG: hypothetical protein V3U93_09970 [Alphaproteobacteria bacterium]
MNAVKYWQDKVAGIGEKLAAARRMAADVDDERRALALASEGGDAGADRKLARLQRKADVAARKIEALALAKSEAVAQTARAKDEEQAAHAQARNDRLRELVEKRAKAVARLEKNLRAVARELDEMGDLAQEIMNFRPARTRAEAVDRPLDPERVRFRLEVFCGFIGLHRWLTEDVNSAIGRKPETLVELESKALARYLGDTGGD